MATPRTFRHLVLTTLTHLALVAFAASGASAQPASKLGPLARAQSARPTGWSQVIIRITPGTGSLLSSLLEQLGARAGRDLPLINGRVALVPNAALAGLAQNPFVEQVALDRPIEGTMERTGATIGATAVRQTYGYDGTGIGVAIVDSGVTAGHDDLAGGNRIGEFVDLVNGNPTAYDDYGHGTHVAGIVAGSGFDSDGRRTGIAPGAHLLVVKALDSTGSGRISDVIAALDYVLSRKNALNIRIVNLSISAGVYELVRHRSAHRSPRSGWWMPESSWSRPRATQAARRRA